MASQGSKHTLRRSVPKASLFQRSKSVTGQIEILIDFDLTAKSGAFQKRHWATSVGRSKSVTQKFFLRPVAWPGPGPRSW